MNRPLKFRAWTGLKMDSNVVVGQLGTFYALIDPNDSACLNPTTKYYGDTPVMQSTGVIDKNGVEIYEGDLVLYKGRTGRVEFIAGMFVVSWDDQTDDPLAFMIIEEMEVVGNIFEYKK